MIFTQSSYNELVPFGTKLFITVLFCDLYTNKMIMKKKKKYLLHYDTNRNYFQTLSTTFHYWKSSLKPNRLLLDITVFFFLIHLIQWIITAHHKNLLLTRPFLFKGIFILHRFLLPGCYIRYCKRVEIWGKGCRLGPQHQK